LREATAAVHLRHLLAEPRAERAVVRHDLVDVDPLERDVGEPLDRRALVAGGDDDGGAKWPSDRELGLPRAASPSRTVTRSTALARSSSASAGAASGQSSRCTLSNEPSRLS
jgi:hypothetical protein